MKVYKSQKQRRSVLLPPEIHYLLKLEALKQKKSMRNLLIEMIKTYLKI
jgi:predicted HicB family RNase H-like nuclease